MLDPKKKQKIIQKFKTHSNDTGSPQVQIAILSEEIDELAGHLKTHKKDFSSRRGLLKKVSERRKLFRYLKREDEQAYESLLKKLQLKPVKPTAEEESLKEEEALAAESEAPVVENIKAAS